MVKTMAKKRRAVMAEVSFSASAAASVNCEKFHKREAAASRSIGPMRPIGSISGLRSGLRERQNRNSGLTGRNLPPILAVTFIKSD
jgi:hypothetical protein